ncbi:MAG TPA: hypothetical protein DIU18_04840 [Gemmatimonadetes bacterium]|nr:hypothetical protein [Gemmatimonadota bacterium]
MKGLLRGLTSNRAETDPHSPDPRLRGRTYAISFDQVWNAALALSGGQLPRWSVSSADDGGGIIRARVRARLLDNVDDVRIAVILDENGQTRVDVTSTSLLRKRDLGANARHIHRFLRALDTKLGATQALILDATREAQFSA